jgi:hypothetical protein
MTFSVTTIYKQDVPYGLANDVDSESPFWKTSSGEPILYQPLVYIGVLF